MMQFKAFFKTTVGMKPQSETSAKSSGDPHKLKDDIKDDKTPKSAKKQNMTHIKKADDTSTMAASVRNAFGGSKPDPAPAPAAPDPGSLASSITNGLNKLKGL